MEDFSSVWKDLWDDKSYLYFRAKYIESGEIYYLFRMLDTIQNVEY